MYLRQKILLLQNVLPDPSAQCGPYTPTNTSRSPDINDVGDIDDHDTIGMLAIDKNGDISSGTSTNGLNHKIPG